MTSKKIYLVRHGQTDFNLQGIVQGSGVDSSINDTGRAQAEAFYQTYRHIKFDKVYTSKLKRTVESVNSFLKAGVPHEAKAGLNEISWGSKEGQKITPEEDAYYHWVLEQWEQGNTSMRIEYGESPEDVAVRQKPVIDHIVSQSQEETILICMHGRALRILLCQLLHYPLKSMDLFEHENLGLYLLNFTGTMFSIVKHNDTRHLAGVNEILSKRKPVVSNR
ncbi:MAG TPA: histidine phosphatase family protein [Cyclobacteriaceae bacterium]|nr:histidine phosphatase family protein [Cyclobacteriaceae bacterium]